MIIVKLMGGLGNQMFQYAAARRLAHLHDTELKLDLSFLESRQMGYTPRSYELSCFNIKAGIASAREVAEITGRGKNWLESVLVNVRQATGLSLLDRNVFSERHFHFDPAVLDLPDNLYLEGYWQSERYFKDIEEIIRSEFSLSAPLTGGSQKIAQEIQSADAVSLHVRRGDYVTGNDKTKDLHGVCDFAYYLKAVDRMAQAVTNPHFFVFSDDPEWVADNLRLHHRVSYVSHSSRMQHEDMYLLSLCKSHVIANSSFSWWGAWLSRSSDKRVIAPARWFNDPSIDISDLIPSSWKQQ